MRMEPMGGAFAVARRFVGMRVAASVLAGALAAAACGNTEGNPDSQPMAGRSSAGGAAASSAGQPQASGTGGRASAGTGQAAGAGGGLTGGAGGGSAARHPLIAGDDACPSAAPMALACSTPGASCVYRGIASGLSETNEPMRCSCSNGAWACVQSDEHGQTSCPDGIVATELPRHGEPCPEPGQSCTYALLAYNAFAGCYCTANETGQAGGGGAGGAETEPTGTWFCGV